MSKKSARIAEMIESLRGGAFDPHYRGYFKCFNQQLFYEAHDVLEELWLTERHQPNDHFYKGLIQLAGAFVHLQKNRLGPAVALFRLSQGYLAKYAPAHENLNLLAVQELITTWLDRLAADNGNPLHLHPPPSLALDDDESSRMRV